MKIFLIYILLFVGILNATLVKKEDIDNAKGVIQLGVFSDKKNIETYLLNFEHVNLHLEPFKKYKNTFKLLIVNIDKKDLNNELASARSLVPDAFINKTFKVHHKPKATLQSKKNIEPKVKLVKIQPPKKLSKIKLIKPKKQKKPIEHSYDKVEAKIHNGLIAVEDINTSNHIIQLGIFNNRENIYKNIEKFNDHKLYLEYSHIINNKQTFKLMIVNVDKKNLAKTLSFAQTIVPDAFINPKLKIIKRKIKVVKHTTSDLPLDKRDIALSKNLKDKISKDREEINLAGKYFYNNKKFDLAYRHFSNYAKDKNVDKRVNFLAGRSAYNIKKYDAALEKYDKVLEDAPENPRTKLEIAQSHMQKQEYAKAEEFFHEVLNSRLVPAKIKENIIMSAKVAQQRKKRNFFNTLLVAGFNYDSNINNDAKAGIYPIYIPSDGDTIYLTNTGDKTSDTIKQLSATFNYTRKIKDEFHIVSNATLFKQLYTKNPSKNLNVISLNVSPTYYQNGQRNLVKFTRDTVYLDNNKYLISTSITPTVSKDVNNTLTYQGSIKLAKKQFEDSANTDKNSKIVELTGAVNYISKKYGLWGATLSIGKESKTQGSRTDVDHNYYSLTLSNTYDLYKDIKLTNTLISLKSNYALEDPNFVSKRNDIKYDFTTGILKPINEQTVLGVNYQLINNKSNHSPFSHTKHLVKTFVTYSF